MDGHFSAVAFRKRTSAVTEHTRHWPSSLPNEKFKNKNTYIPRQPAHFSPFKRDKRDKNLI